MVNYHVKYNQSCNGVNTSYELDTHDCIWNEFPLNTQWSVLGCYAGAKADNFSLMGSRSVLNFTGWKSVLNYSNMCDYTVSKSVPNVQQNLRFMIKFGSTSLETTRQNYLWTELDSGLVEAIIDGYDVNHTNIVGIYDPYHRTAKNISVTGTANNPFLIMPVDSLKINDLIFVPYFHIWKIEYYNHDTDIDGYANVSISFVGSYTWAEVKNIDKTPAGNDYNSAIFDTGFEKLTNSTHEDGHEYLFCAGCTLIPYYGKCSNTYYNDIYTAGINPNDGNVYGDRQTLGSVQSDIDDCPEYLNTKYRYANLLVMTETKSSVNDGIIYQLPTGIKFSNSVVSSNSADFVINTNYALIASYQTFSANSSWSPFWINANAQYSFIYKNYDAESTSEESSPLLEMPGTYFELTSDIEYLTQPTTSTPTATRYYFDTDNPVGYSWTKSNRTCNPSVIGYFSIRDLWATIASMGCYIADSVTTAQKAPTGKYTGNNNHLYLGYMDSNGVTNGIMLQGSELSSSTQSDIDDIINDTPYVPVNPKQDDDSDPDRDNVNPPSREGDNIPIHLNNRFGLFDSFLTMYNLTEVQLSNFGNALLGNPLNYRGNFQKDLSEELSGTYDISSILNYIVSVKMYPFSVATLPNTSIPATSKIYMGTGEFGIPIGTPCRKLTSSISVLNAGSLHVAPLTPYKDFRDYYNTNIVCYMPYCGCVELNPMDIMNTTLQCYYLIDFLTGDCTALLYSIGSNGLNYPVAIANGNIGIDIPLSATNTGQLEAVKRMQNSAKAHTIVSFVNAGINAAENFLSMDSFNPQDAGDIARVADIFSNAVTNFTNIWAENNANPYGANRSARSAVAMPLMPAGSGATNFMLNNSVYLQIRRGTYSKPKNYARTMGYPTTYSKQLREVHGLTFCSGVNVSGINCTQEEKEMIRSALEGGTILP